MSQQQQSKKASATVSGSVRGRRRVAFRRGTAFAHAGRILARMAGPEVLHADGARLGRRRGWLVLGTVLLLWSGWSSSGWVARRPETSPGPTQPPEGPPTTTRDTWPDDLPRGAALVADGLVTTTETGTGRRRTTEVVADPARTTLTALGDGVLVWGDGASTERVLPGLGRPPRNPARGRAPFGDGLVPGTDGPKGVGGASRPARCPDLAVGRRRGAREPQRRGRLAGSSLTVPGGLLEVVERGVHPLFPAPRPPAPSREARSSPPARTAT